jgi:hypothetical protein
LVLLLLLLLLVLLLLPVFECGLPEVAGPVATEHCRLSAHGTSSCRAHAGA